MPVLIECDDSFRGRVEDGADPGFALAQFTSAGPDLIDHAAEGASQRADLILGVSLRQLQFGLGFLAGGDAIRVADHLSQRPREVSRKPERH